MATVKDKLAEVAKQQGAGWVPLQLDLYDEELNMVIKPMEQNLSLLRILYRIAIILSLVIGLGLSVLLTLQNAKNASIMRVLGTTKKRTLAMLCAEQIVVCLFGLAAGICVIAFAGWGVEPSALSTGLYFLCTLIGAVAGGILVAYRPPLELLQTRE